MSLEFLNIIGQKNNDPNTFNVLLNILRTYAKPQGQGVFSI